MSRASLHKTRAFQIRKQQADFSGAGPTPAVGTQVIEVDVNVADLGVLVRAVTAG